MAQLTQVDGTTTSTTTNLQRFCGSKPPHPAFGHRLPRGGGEGTGFARDFCLEDEATTMTALRRSRGFFCLLVLTVGGWQNNSRHNHFTFGTRPAFPKTARISALPAAHSGPQSRLSEGGWRKDIDARHWGCCTYSMQGDSMQVDSTLYLGG